MMRLVTYLLVLGGSLAFWIGELVLNYGDYVAIDPMDMGTKYQRMFLYQRDHLLVTEFGFPLIMVVALTILLLFKMATRSVRIPLAFVMMLCAEFWAYRKWVYQGRMSDLFLQSQYEDPTFREENMFLYYFIAFTLAFLLVVLLREVPLSQDRDALHERLRRSLRKWQ